MLFRSTAFNKPPTTQTNGQALVNVTQLAQQAQQLQSLLSEKISDTRANEIMNRIRTQGGGGPGRGGQPGGGATTRNFNSIAELYKATGMTLEEMALIEDQLSDLNSQTPQCKVNVNTASEVVLACIPGLDRDKAASLGTYRQSNASKLNSVGWVAEVLDDQALAQAGRYLTARSYQFTADIAAVGHHGRGYRRNRIVFDTRSGLPKILYRQDMSYSGWALGDKTRLQLQQLASNTIR